MRRRKRGAHACGGGGKRKRKRKRSRRNNRIKSIKAKEEIQHEEEEMRKGMRRRGKEDEWMEDFDFKRSTKRIRVNEGMRRMRRIRGGDLGETGGTVPPKN